MRRFSPIRFAISLLALAIVAPAVPIAATAQTLPTVRIASPVSDPFAEVFYAQEMGFFKKEGLDVQVTAVVSGTASTLAVAGGAADIGGTSPVNLAPAFSRGVPLTLIAGGGIMNAAADGMYVAKDSPIKIPKDFEGKTIGVAGLGDIMQVGATAYLSANGVDMSKVRFVEIPFQAMGAAVTRGTVDAVVLSEPFTKAAKDLGTTREFAKVMDAISPHFLEGAWFTSPAYAQKNPEVIKRFQAAVYAAGRWANKNHDRSAEIVAKYSKNDVALVRSVIRSVYADTISRELLQPPFDAEFKQGHLEKPVDSNDMIYRAPADAH